MSGGQGSSELSVLPYRLYRIRPRSNPSEPGILVVRRWCGPALTTAVFSGRRGKRLRPGVPFVGFVGAGGFLLPGRLLQPTLKPLLKTAASLLHLIAPAARAAQKLLPHAGPSERQIIQAGQTGEYLARLLPKGTHEYRSFIRPSELAGWLRRAGLVLEGMTGLTYNPITRLYRLNDSDVSVNYMVRATKPG